MDEIEIETCILKGSASKNRFFFALYMLSCTIMLVKSMLHEKLLEYTHFILGCPKNRTFFYISYFFSFNPGRDPSTIEYKSLSEFFEHPVTQSRQHNMISIMNTPQ